MSATENQVFNPEIFANMQLNEALSTELTPIPEGEYTAVSSPVGAESFKTFDIRKGERAGQKAIRLDVEWTINDETGALKALIGREPKVRQGIMLDVKSDGNIETGKGRNVTLGRLREALNQNQQGRPWTWSNLGGAVAKIRVKHRIEDGNTYVEVAGVAKA